MKKISNYFLTFIIILFGIGLIFFSSSNIVAVRKSLDLFLNSVFPSLFPFLIVTELLSYTSLVPWISSKFKRVMPTVFNVSAIGIYPFIMGIISGYPVGARIVASLREENKISRIDGERLLVFTNNAGPLFIIGCIGCSIYLNSSIGFILYFVHFLSSIITGFVFGNFYKTSYREESVNSQTLDFSSLGDIIGKCIKKAFYTLSTVCGFVIIFSLIVSMIDASKILNIFNDIWIKDILFGILEITTGIQLISLIKNSTLFYHLIATSFLLGIGGISVLLQVWSVISKTDLSIKPYIIGKIFNGFVSAFIMICLLKFFPIFQFAL